MRRLASADLSRRFFELKEDIAQASASGSAEIENLLHNKEKLLGRIRKLGEENFKKYFIFNEEELSTGEIASLCGLSESAANEIKSLIRSIDVFNEFFVPSDIPQNNLSYNRVAVISGKPGGYDIQYTSAHWARGVYDINYEKIDKLIKAGKFSESEKKDLNKLLEKVEMLNIRKSLVHNIISEILKKQSEFLSKNGEGEIVPYLQSELAKTLGVHPSIISRAISGRSVETPWGEEKPLKDFFCSGKSKQKRDILEYIKNILDQEFNAKAAKPLSDKEITEALRKKYRIKIAPRTTAKYRTELKIASSFHRKP